MRLLDLVVESFHALMSKLLANFFVAFEVADNLRSTLLLANLGICQNKV